tara:strand:- start:934 stop:1269 length:336 start_codon:yes stop_codon:yes gene_type:complete
MTSEEFIQAAPTRGNKMHIKVSIKNVYGSDLIYPECDNAEEFARLTGLLLIRLTGTKTLSQSATIESIRRLGYSVEVIAQTIADGCQCCGCITTGHNTSQMYHDGTEEEQL